MVHYRDRFVVEWDEYSGDELSYMGIRTHDNKGHLKRLEQYVHSPKWQNLGSMSDINEYRYHAKGATKVKGSFRVDPQSFNGINKLQFTTVLDVTPSELESAYEQRGSTWDDIQQSLRWAKDDAMEQAHEQIADRQRQCDHNHAVFPDNFVGKTRNSNGYCEDCGEEITENKKLAH